MDCVQLAAALLEEAGLATGLEFPPYFVDFGDHADTSPVLAWFKARPEWDRRSGRRHRARGRGPVPGRAGWWNYVGVALGNQRFCHCLRGARGPDLLTR
ncbi:MAG: hypothetical protein M5U12_06790 [Verrucomicrobia bacterium]|nr:hypothetical protein [Verrucomicrobiota bacterium]